MRKHKYVMRRYTNAGAKGSAARIYRALQRYSDMFPHSALEFHTAQEVVVKVLEMAQERRILYNVPPKM